MGPGDGAPAALVTALPRRAAGTARARRRYAIALGAVFALWWVALAIRPRYRADWALENVLVIAAIGALVLSARWLVLSRLSYTLLFVFFCIHAVGAHFTYSEVPYDAWARALTGRSLNEALGWQRNHFDRTVHLAYGLLLTYPIQEVLVRQVGVRGAARHVLPVLVVMGLSGFYELAEWLAAAVFDPELGIAYVGAQGDTWDAQKDMALAALGAIACTGFSALLGGAAADSVG